MAGAPSPGDRRKAYPLRLDPALHAALERAAAADFRSVNAEIEVLLREALQRRGMSVPAAAPRPRGRPPADRGRGPAEGS
jgi:hypothetical protein